jgi:uncharacterized membrane protein YqjE
MLLANLLAKGASAFLGRRSRREADRTERLERLKHSLVALAERFTEAATRRGQLATVELREYLTYLTETAVWGVICLVAGGGAVLMIALTIIFLNWNTHRVLASVLVTVGAFGISAFASSMAYLRLRAITHAVSHQVENL